MIIKGIIRNIYGLVLVAVFFVPGAFAQGNDRLLVQGDPPLMQSTVDQLVDFFEFGLHGKFTASQRDTFQSQRITEWKSDPKAKETFVSILKMRSELMGLNDEKLVEAQTTLQKFLLDMIKNQPDDETCKLLNAVYESGLRNAVSSGRLPPAGAADPSSLMGTWGTGSQSGIGFVGKTTGTFTSGGGTQVQYTFKPGGKYEYGSLTEQTMYNCTTKFSTFKTGIVEVRGGTLTFIPQTATFTSEDSCVARNNYRKPAGLDRESFNWSIRRDDSGLMLCLQNATINGCAYKR